METTDNHKRSGASPWVPFSHTSFTILWAATLLSNIGTWMHDVSAAWLMTSLSASPMVVAMVQAATSGAMALFALPAGAMADLFDRKRLLIALAAFKASLAVLLGILTALGLVSAWSLLAITFLLGVGSALMAPVWQSVVPTLVPREALKPAVALNSMGINIARAIGPTIGGILIVSAGIAAAFFLNAASELVIIAALLFWTPATTVPRKLPEQFVPAMIAGVRFASNSSALKNVLWRAAGFFLFASAFWALLPLVARQTLGGDAALYGMIVGAVGAGAVLGALVLPQIDARLGSDGSVQAGTVLTALVLALLGFVPSQSTAIVAGCIAGVAWIWVLSTLNVAAQNALPDWVRGRGLSIYGLVFFGAMTVGSLGWGALATWVGISLALGIAAVGLLLAIPFTRAHRLSTTPADLTPSGHWPDPVVAVADPGDRGPVMVTVEYRIAAEKQAEFTKAVHRLADERRRDGAYQWGLMQDAADPDRFTEYFLVESWNEHQRQHARVTRADADLQGAIAKLISPGSKPRITHWLASE
ncbi:MAG: MFS transporter [Hyphomicrobiaceae bacterium]|nr:MFS transporter [Hyphomicrobiaceae bacterium]